MIPLFYERATRLGVEMLTATFAGCNFCVRGGEEMTVTLPDEQFIGEISTFNIARVSPTEIQTTVTISRCADWSKVRSTERDHSIHGSIEHS